MASSVVGALRVVLGLDSAEFTSGINRANRATGQFAKQGKTFETATRGMSTALRGLTAALGIISVGAAGKAYLSLADEAKNLTAQLKLATAQSGNFGQAQADVKRIADATRNGLAETTDLYATFMRNGRELGITQDQAAKATETFAKTLKISGAGAAEASSATTQFSQALASGVLRGDEFNGIMESSPRLARLLADSLDVPVGSLRAMAEQGELTADKLLRALTDTKFTASIDAEFKQMPVTFDQAMTQVHNAAIVTFGAFDQGGEFSTMLANFVSGGADGFKGLERSAEDLGINIRSAFSGLSDAFEPMLEGALSVFGQVNDEALTLRDSIASLLGAVDDVRNIPRTLALKAGERFKEETGLTLPQSWLVGDSQASNMRGRFVSGFDASRRRLTGTAGQRRFDAFAGGYDALGNPTGGVGPASNRGGSAGGKKSGGSSSAKRAKTQVDEAAKAADELKRNLDSILASLDPKAAQMQSLLEKGRDLDSALASQLINPTQWQEARTRLSDEIAALEKEMADSAVGQMFIPGIGMSNPIDLSPMFASAHNGLEEMARQFQESGEKSSKAMVDMVNNSLHALNELQSAISSGGILGILSAGFNAFGSVSQTGLLGKGLQGTFKDFSGLPGFATGGSFRVGGAPGIDKNLVAFRATRGEMVDIRKPGNDNGGVVVVHVQANDYFDAKVAQGAAQVAAPMAVRAGTYASQDAQQSMSRRARRTIR